MIVHRCDGKGCDLEVDRVPATWTTVTARRGSGQDKAVIASLDFCPACWARLCKLIRQGDAI